MEGFDAIRDIVAGHTNRHVGAWKESGRPVVGYMCPYTPPELLMAAGALPLRLRGVGSEDSARADAYLSGRLCTYVRHVVSMALSNRFSFLDGVIASNTCDHVRRSADVFRKKSRIPFVGFVSVPRTPRESLLPYYVEELRNLYAALCKHLGAEASDAALRAAIATQNETRRLLTELNELRLPAEPKLTGSEALEIHIASQVTPAEVFQPIARDLLGHLRDRDGLDTERARLVLIGAELDEPEYVEVLESQGALVVADRLCWGARSVLEPIDEDAPDPMEALARANFFRPSCARMMGDFPARWEHILELVASSAADGVIFERLMFCDPWGADLHNLNRRTRESRLPLLALTREYGVVPTGQLRTRVQAFLEKLEIAKARASA